ncbi:protein JTB-like [Conger conger]|uniref:protein JTB-like n=1 Tax=Conger conger TaxID=82655 RepID=UPI002A5A72EF|nr:protein JTB-like [Conger conger]
MGSGCRISAQPVAIYVVFCGWMSLRVFGAAVLNQENTSVATAAEAMPCWQVEEFVVLAECALCSDFQTKTWSECSPTGYVERVNCTKSQKDEYKSCRSVVTEEHLFWRFEGIMLALAVLFALLVVSRQRALDRLVSEKVRKQIESI